MRGNDTRGTSRGRREVRTSSATFRRDTRNRPIPAIVVDVTSGGAKGRRRRVRYRVAVVSGLDGVTTAYVYFGGVRSGGRSDHRTAGSIGGLVVQFQNGVDDLYVRFNVECLFVHIREWRFFPVERLVGVVWALSVGCWTGRVFFVVECVSLLTPFFPRGGRLLLSVVGKLRLFLLVI